eukprot:7391218-Prymnesium_polylepis.2
MKRIGHVAMTRSSCATSRSAWVRAVVAGSSGAPYGCAFRWALLSLTGPFHRKVDLLSSWQTMHAADRPVSRSRWYG